MHLPRLHAEGIEMSPNPDDQKDKRNAAARAHRAATRATETVMIAGGTSATAELIDEVAASIWIALQGVGTLAAQDEWLIEKYRAAARAALGSARVHTSTPAIDVVRVARGGVPDTATTLERMIAFDEGRKLGRLRAQVELHLKPLLGSDGHLDATSAQIERAIQALALLAKWGEEQ